MPRHSPFLALALLAVPMLPAQDTPPAGPPAPPVLENTGKPMRLPLACTFEDIQAAGLACTQEDPCPVYLELTAVEAVGTRLFAAGNLHTETLTLFSTLLGSDDAGHTWRELHDRIRAATLDRIEFFDRDTGWASGESLSPLPQDPFLLATTDGGKTWKQQFVFDESADDHFGTIQQFAFADRNEGSLVIDRGQGSDSDRYERYETPNGGQTWGIRESSNQPLRLKAAPQADPDWRIRADRASASFRLEHRQGASWTPVASFLVNVGSCKP